MIINLLWSLVVLYRMAWCVLYICMYIFACDSVHQTVNKKLQNIFIPLHNYLRSSLKQRILFCLFVFCCCCFVCFFCVFLFCFVFFVFFFFCSFLFCFLFFCFVFFLFLSLRPTVLFIHKSSNINKYTTTVYQQILMISACTSPSLNSPQSIVPKTWMTTYTRAYLLMQLSWALIRHLSEISIQRKSIFD